MAGLSGVTDSGYTASNYSGATFYSKWQNNGSLKGVFSGNWSESFVYQSSYRHQGLGGYLWSRSAYASNANYAYGSYFDASDIRPDITDFRNSGFGVRCLLN